MSTDLKHEFAQIERLEHEVTRLEKQLQTARAKLDAIRRRVAKDVCRGPVLGSPPLKIVRRSGEAPNGGDTPSKE